jgi:hypothetical protein
VNVAFVGCGGMAAHYIGVYRDLDWVRVLAYIEIGQDFSAALAPEVDAVIINNPQLAAPRASRGSHRSRQAELACLGGRNWRRLLQ